MQHRAARRPLLPLCAAALAALLGGCAVGPNFTAPNAEAPAAWATKAPAQPLASVTTNAEPADARWWSGFGDAELSSLIDRAVTANLGARQAVLRIEEARAQRSQAAAGAWPNLDAVAGYQSTRISERTAITSLIGSVSGKSGGAPGGVSGALPGLTNPFDQYQYGLTASWELDLFGRVRRAVEAADADTQAALEDARAVRVALMAEVAAAYIDLRSAQARRTVAAEKLATCRSLLKLATDARRADLGDDLDVARASAAVATDEAQLPPLDQEIVADKNQLTLLLALQPGKLDGELDAARPTPPLPPSVPIGLPSDLARRRPDIRRAEAQLHAAVARQGVAVADLYPRISLAATGGLQASRPAGLTDWAARYFTVGPSLDLPVFDAGQRIAAVHVQDARTRQAALAYAQTVLSALAEAETAISAFGQEQARRAALQTAVDQAGAALDLARRRYVAGTVSFRDVLDAEDKRQQAELALTASITATAQDLVGLYKALGGGWEG